MSEQTQLAPDATWYILGPTVIDGTGREPYAVGGVLVERGRIARVDERGSSRVRDTAAPVIDATGVYLLPGLWDSHAHLGMVFPQNDFSKTPHHEAAADRTVRCGRAAMDALQYGITSVRVVGEADYVDVAWKKAFNSGMFEGPRLVVCGRPIIATGGHGWQSGKGVQVDGVAECRRAAREQMMRGADQIKIMITGGVASSTETMYESQMTPDEVRAIVEVAALKGRKVCAHVGGPMGARLAIEAGVASIEHGYLLDDEVVAMMVEHGTYYVPTLAVTQDEEYIRANWSAFAIDKALRAAENHRRSFQRALAAGVKIAAGEDLTPFAERLIPEIETMVNAGMSEMQAIVSATRNGAELADCLEDTGTVEVGKEADLIVLRKNPLDDIANLRELDLVFRRGRIVAGTTTPNSRQGATNVTA